MSIYRRTISPQISKSAQKVVQILTDENFRDIYRRVLAPAEGFMSPYLRFTFITKNILHCSLCFV